MAAFERATVGLFLWWSASNAFAANPGGVLSMGRAGVAETAERIEAEARARGLSVVARIDHSGEARRDGYLIRPIHALLIDHGSGGAPTRVVIWRAQGGVTVASVDERPAGFGHAAAVARPPLPRAAVPAGEAVRSA